MVRIRLKRSDSIDEEKPSMMKDLLLRIKIKVPNSNACDQEDRIPKQENRVYNKKNFSSSFSSSSGRVLEGHKRVNNQVEDDKFLENLKKPKVKIHQQKLKNHNATDGSVSEPNSNTNNNNNKSTRCSECGKTFPSLKSLFGHLRSHPERNWRGMQPPPTAKSSSSSSTVSDSIAVKMDNPIDSTMTTGRSAIDLTQFLPRWPVTAKRGRESISSTNSEEKDLIPVAFKDLLMLASLESDLSNRQGSVESEGTQSEFLFKKSSIDENLDESKKQQRRSEESESGNRDFMSKKLKIDETGPSKGRNDERVSEDINFQSREVKVEEGNNVSTIGFDSKAVKMEIRSDQNSGEEANFDLPEKHLTLEAEIVRKRKKKLKLKDLGAIQELGVIDGKQSSISSDKYKCTTCNKSFPSHQALGGHISSHSKGKKSLHTTDMEHYADVVREFNEMGSKVVSKHRCKICNKTYPTGQALGGHKRFHWIGRVEAHTSDSVVLPEEVHKTGLVFDFDLNEMPKEDDVGLESASTN